jgi:glutamate-1-semialdehyde 2,1-aminomutase
MESSENFRDRALQFFPGGSNGEYGIPEGDAPVLERGHGSRVWDTGGREYLDMTMAWGAALVGHAHPKVLEAAAAAASKGANFAAINRPMVELAERIADLSPCVERIRFVASGTEATMLCLRTARAATGRPKILKFEGAYHGQHPEGVTSLVGSDPPELPQPDSSGTGAPWVERDVLVAPYNDLAATRQILTDYADELAAVIVEPLHRCIPPVEGFLQGLREVTTSLGIVLVFDEVVTGFRLALGGAQEYYGVSPDLVAYGKGLGGGFPIGVFGGRADVMEAVNEQRLPGPNYAWSASTTGGNPVSSAAALATIDIFSEPGVYDRLHAMGRQLREQLGQALAQVGETAQVLGDGPLAQSVFLDRPVQSHRDWLAADRERGRAVMFELLRSGVFLNPMGTKLYLSLAHTEADLDEFTTHFVAALRSTRLR